MQRVPLLVVPPTINKYYILDLAPGRSLVEYLVDSGQQVFVVSWRNPDARHRDWDADTYGQAILEALEATRRICRVASSALGLCSGGILAPWCSPIWPPPGDRTWSPGSAWRWRCSTRPGRGRRERRSTMAPPVRPSRPPRRGYLDGRTLAEVFAWLRPGDLIWPYWVNNYLAEGARHPLRHPLLERRHDQTHRGPAPRLHPAGRRQRPHPPQARPPCSAHLWTWPRSTTPWQACYRSTQLLGGPQVRPVQQRPHRLHGQPAGEPQRQRTAPDNPPDPADWLGRSTTEGGSWWPDFARWLEQRGGGEKAPPRRLGAAGFQPLDAAPGTYVLDR